MSRFTDHLGLVEAEGADGRPKQREGRTLWVLCWPLSYEVGALGSGVVITVPRGYETDLASIPQFAWSLGFSPSGPWAKAAVVHDYLYTLGGRLPDGRAYSRAAADKVLDEAMAVLGVPAWRRAVIWAAVRLGGALGWGRTR